MQNESIDTAEYLILENIYASTPQNPSLNQRELAQNTRTSLGLTNSILKRLAQKGWITVKKINSRNIRYAITLEGLDEIFHRSYRYFKRTINNVVYYKDSIDEFIKNANQNGANTVLLVGISDLDFIVEHCCSRYGLSFVKSADRDTAPAASNTQVLIVYAENIPVIDTADNNSLYLSQFLLRTPNVS